MVRRRRRLWWLGNIPVGEMIESGSSGGGLGDLVRYLVEVSEVLICIAVVVVVAAAAGRISGGS